MERLDGKIESIQKHISEKITDFPIQEQNKILLEVRELIQNSRQEYLYKLLEEKNIIENRIHELEKAINELK